MNIPEYGPKEVRRVLTGSVETETAIRKILNMLPSWSTPLSLTVVKKTIGDYWFKVLTSGRSGTGERYEGSTAADDTGGFLEINDGQVVVTQKFVDVCR